MATVSHVAVGPPVRGTQGRAVDVDQGEILIIVTRQVGDVGARGPGPVPRVENVQRYGLIRPLVRGLGAGFSEGLMADIGDDNGQRGVEPLTAGLAARSGAGVGGNVGHILHHW